MSKTIDELKTLIQKDFDIAPNEIDENAAFSEYGLDSLTLSELIFSIDDTLHVVIPDAAFSQIRTLAQLASVVDELRSQGCTAQA